MTTKERNEVLINATTQMELENIKRSEKTHTQRTTYCTSFTCEMYRIGKSHP